MSSDNASVALANGIRKLYETGEGSDFIIKCNDKQFKVHKVIISCQEGFFHAASKKGFKEGNHGIIELNEDDPDVLGATLRFLYGLNYICESDQPAVFHAQVFAAAEYYQLPGLQLEALRQFKEESPNSSCIDMNQFLSAARIVYEGTPGHVRGMRDVLVDVFYTSLPHVILEEPDNASIVKEIPELLYDLVRKNALQMENSQKANVSGVKTSSSLFQTATPHPSTSANSNSLFDRIAGSGNEHPFNASNASIFSSATPSNGPTASLFAQSPVAPQQRSLFSNDFMASMRSSRTG